MCKIYFHWNELSIAEIPTYLPTYLDLVRKMHPWRERSWVFPKISFFSPSCFTHMWNQFANEEQKNSFTQSRIGEIRTSTESLTYSRGREESTAMCVLIGHNIWLKECSFKFIIADIQEGLRLRNKRAKFPKPCTSQKSVSFLCFSETMSSKKQFSLKKLKNNDL